MLDLIMKPTTHEPRLSEHVNFVISLLGAIRSTNTKTQRCLAIQLTKKKEEEKQKKKEEKQKKEEEEKQKKEEEEKHAAATRARDA